MIGIVDCGTSNLRSVENVFTFLGSESTITGDPALLDRCDRLVLPGVGTFAHAMTNLKSSGLDQAIREFSASGRPVLGICLGMQLLADLGTEPSETSGLGLIPGKIVKLEADVRLPHVGWNTVNKTQEHPLLKGVKAGVDFYFVHSYYFQAADESHVLAQADYGFPFPCIVARDNVIGTQFHPEKSQKHGLKLLKNFLKMAC